LLHAPKFFFTEMYHWSNVTSVKINMAGGRHIG